MTLMNFANGINEVAQAMDQILSNDLPTTGSSFRPSVNILESDDAYQLKLAAPGRKKEDFNINIEKDLLSISSDFKTEEEAATKTFSRKEFTLQSFKRSFNLPKTVEAEKIEASYEQGILSITLPKKEEAKPMPARKINIA